MKTFIGSVAALSALLVTGCSTTYVAPSGRADFSALVPQQASVGALGDQPPGDLGTIGERAAPTAVFPVGIAFARLQAPDYRSFSTDLNGGVYGTGRYSIFTTREVEDESDLQRLAGLPEMAGIVSLNRLLLPANLQTDAELRRAAARLNAEMVVIYTFDTSFYDRNRSLTLMSLTLGNARTQKVNLHVTATALVLDTHTGFIYAAFETNENQEFRTNVWKKEEHVDAARRNSERAAFKKLVTEFETAWPRIVERAKQGA